MILCPVCSHLPDFATGRYTECFCGRLCLYIHDREWMFTASMTSLGNQIILRRDGMLCVPNHPYDHLPFYSVHGDPNVLISETIGLACAQEVLES